MLLGVALYLTNSDPRGAYKVGAYKYKKINFFLPDRGNQTSGD